MKKRTSLKDIAREVGVSPALVSYVLNEKKTGRINKEVAQKIKDTARELNYRTNEIARGLKTNKTNTIGFIVSNIANPFSSNLARIVEDEAAKNNLTVLFGSSDENPAKFEKLVNTFLNRYVDGLIIAPGEHTIEQVRYLQQQEIPFVLIDRYFPTVDTNYVVLDNYKASYDAINHLINCGSKRLGMINYETTLHNLNERTTGYLAALENLTGDYTKELLRMVHGPNLQAMISGAIDELLDLRQPVDAILFASNEIAMYGVVHLNNRKIKVPDDISIITFDEMISWDLFYAPLTYIKQPLQKMGELATKILLENIAGNLPVQQINLAGSLIIRASTRS